MDTLAPLYVDDALLVFEKASGLLSVPGRGADKQDSLSARAQARYADALVVHRLDMDTSGLLLMARGIVAQRAVNRAFASRQVDKRYVAVVYGLLASPVASADGWGLIDLPLSFDWPNRPRHIVDHQQGKPSQTRWRVLGHDHERGTTRLELEPVTGRSHQLRVHLQALGHPIIGDTLYAPPEAQAMADRLLLHAARLEIDHPLTRSRLVFESPPPF